MKANEAYQQYVISPTPEHYEVFGKALHRFTLAIVAKEFGSRFEGLQEAAGEACLHVLSKLDSFDSTKGSFADWVYGITCNACKDMLRAYDIHNEQVFIGECDASVAPKHVDRLLLKSLVEKLSEGDQKLVNLKLNGLSNEDIAREMGTTDGYIKIRWYRLQRKLRTLGGGN